MSEWQEKMSSEIKEESRARLESPTGQEEREQNNYEETRADQNRPGRFLPERWFKITQNNRKRSSVLIGEMITWPHRKHAGVSFPVAAGAAVAIVTDTTALPMNCSHGNLCLQRCLCARAF